MRKSILLCWGSVGLFKWIKIIMCALLIFALAGCQRTQTDEVVTKKNQALQGPSAITPLTLWRILTFPLIKY